MNHLVYIIFSALLFLPALLKSQIEYLELMDKNVRQFTIHQVGCQRIETPPVIDGALNDKIWQRLEKITGFRITDKVNFGELASRQTEVMIGYDTRFIYIAFTCFEPGMDKIRAECKRFDNPDILYDDRIEILLDTEHDHKNIIRLAVNSDGITYDTRLERPVQYSISYIKGSDNWNTEWRAKVKKQDNKWTGEVAIAIDRIYSSKIVQGTTWGFNIVRDSRSEFLEGKRGIKIKPDREISALEPVNSFVLGKISDRWIEPNQFTDLVFSQNALTVDQLGFHEAYANYNGSIWHKPQFFGDNPLLISATNNTVLLLAVKCIVETENFNGQILSYEDIISFQPEEKKTFSSIIKIRDDERQVFRLSLYNEQTGNLLYETSYDTRVPPFVEFDLSSVYALDEHRENHIRVAPVTIPEIPEECSIRLTMMNSQGGIVASDEISNLNPYAFISCFEDLNITELKTDNYIIQSKIEKDDETIGFFEHYFTRTVKESYPELHAENTTYSFGGEKGKSLVVHFPEGERFVFWEHASYIPWWDLNNMAVTYEFMESWNHGNQGCSEPMQDKENRYSKAEIIENSPARVVVLWRYALADPNYQILFNEWVYEYYYLYPDGTGVREIRFFPNSDIPHEVLQPQYVFPTGVVPQQMFRDTACVLMNLNGEQIVNLLSEPVLTPPESTGKWNEEIMRIYLKNRKHPYLVWSEDDELFPNPINNGLIVGDVKRSMGGHWPLQPMNVDVYSVVGTNKPYHSWLGSIHVNPIPEKQPNRWVHLIGVTDKTNEHLITVAKNWLNAPSPNVRGMEFTGYDKVQKAYVFDNPSKNKVQIKFENSGGLPVIHPAFIIRSDDIDQIKITVNGTIPDAGKYKTSRVNYENKPAILIWVGHIIHPGDKIEMVMTNKK